MTAAWEGAPRLLAITNATAWFEHRAAADAFAVQLDRLCSLARRWPSVRTDMLLRAHAATGAVCAAAVAQCVAAAGPAVGIAVTLPAGTDDELPAALAAVADAGARFVQVPEFAAHRLSAVLGARADVAPDLGIGRSCHGADGVAAAFAVGADFAILAPIYATPAKPGVAPLGAEAFAAIAKAYPGRVVALGGIDAARAADLCHKGAAGIAAMRAAWTAEAPALFAACCDHAA